MKIKSGFVLKNIADSYIVVSVGDRVKEFNGVITLNETGVFLWKKLEIGATEEELVKALLSEYDVDEATAKNDVASFIGKLTEAKLLK